MAELKTPLPSADSLRSILGYDILTGALWFLPGHRYAGRPAFIQVAKNGYLCGRARDRVMLAHRVAWALHYGDWPKGEIDHINGRKDDNRISNLRDVGHTQNQRNTKKPATNTSGTVGVYWHKGRKRWTASIRVDGVLLNLGRWLNKEDAAAARLAAEKQHGFHPNHGRRA